MSIFYMKQGLLAAILRFKDVFYWSISGLQNFLIYVSVLIVSLLTPYKDMITIVCFLSIIDWVLAVINAIRRNTLKSSKMLSLVGKFILYCIGFLLAGACKHFMDVGIIEGIITTSIFLGEAISLVSNMILVWPSFPVLHLLDKLLKSELADKLNLSKEDVEEAIKNSTKKKK